MSIELRCESCGKLLKAPAGAAGKRKQCPSCGHELYVPTPGNEIEELPLAPEDTADRLREEALLAERRRIDRAIAHEDAGDASRAPAGRAASSGGATLQQAVVAFLVAMRDSDLNQADALLPALQRQRAEALRVVDALAADQIPPAELANVPSGVYQGFLKNLRSQLS